MVVKCWGGCCGREPNSVGILWVLFGNSVVMSPLYCFPSLIPPLKGGFNQRGDAKALRALAGPYRSAHTP